jgi:lipopolysaccharide export system permease protein
MKFNSITNLYILREMSAPFFINVLVFSFLFLMAKMVEITNWIVNYNLNVWSVLALIAYMMPWLLIFIIPMSVMMAVLLTFLRLSGDNEIVALKACGLSIYGLLPPVLFIGLAGFLLTGFMTLYGAPKAKTALKDMAVKVASSNIDIGLKERTFNDAFKNVMLYVNEIDLKNRKLIDVFIEDKRRPDVVSTVIAPEGRLFSDPENLMYHLVLSNGTIHQTNVKEHSANSIRFDTYKLSLDLQKEFEGAETRYKSRQEMSLAELRRFMQDCPSKDEDYYDAMINLHRRFSIPMACLSLALLAFPLGIQSKSSKRSYGLVLCLFFFLLYYIMLTAGYAFGENGDYPPQIGMWMPNLVMTCLALYFLYQTARERTLKIELIGRRAQRFFARFSRYQKSQE